MFQIWFYACTIQKRKAVHKCCFYNCSVLSSVHRFAHNTALPLQHFVLRFCCQKFNTFYVPCVACANPFNDHISPASPWLKLDEFRLEIQRRDQEIMAMAAKMKTLEEQHQVHIRSSLCRALSAGHSMRPNSVLNRKYSHIIGRTINVTLPCWRNRCVPRRSTTICSRQTLKSCAPAWRRRTAWSTRRPRTRLAPYKIAIACRASWPN